jgi:hypothetical protein
MTKYHPYPRRELRRVLRRWAGRNRWLLAVGTGCLLAFIAFETWMLGVSTGNTALRWYLTGALQVAIVAVFIGALGTTFLAHEREAILYLRGSWGEDFTKDELKRARRKKLIWGWVDSVTLQSGDIDHLVVTRAGGLVAIDSKWRSSAQHLDPAALAQEAKKARLRAEGVVQTVLRSERGSHRARARAFRVSPLVVVWGAARDGVPHGAAISDVDIIKGSELVDWLGNLQGDAIDEPAAAEILAEVERFRSGAWTAATRR